MRPSSTAIRALSVDRARLDLKCRGSYVARVLDAGNGRLNLACEAQGGASFAYLDLDVPLLHIDCRCPTGGHDLDAVLVAHEAMKSPPGSPHIVMVSIVSIQ
jgi:hypothetical protein